MRLTHSNKLYSLPLSKKPADLNWNMDTAASSHLNSSRIRQFVRDNKCTIEFNEFGFSVKDFWTRQILLRCDSTGDLYPVTSPSYPKAFLDFWTRQILLRCDSTGDLYPVTSPSYPKAF
nr:ribonuclease H-like domain-containing protein [Tanacetum cinerariifolium]